MAANCTTDRECADLDTCGRYRCDVSAGECYLPWGSEPCSPGRVSNRLHSRRGFDGGLWFSNNNIETPRLWFNASAEEDLKSDGDTVKPVDNTYVEKPRKERQTSQSEPTYDRPRSESVSDTGGRGDKITIRGDLDNIEGFLSQAQSRGKLKGRSASEVKSVLTAAAMRLTGGGDNPGTGKFWKCKPSCSADGGSGTCALGGCFNILNCCPPNKFEITWWF